MFFLALGDFADGGKDFLKLVASGKDFRQQAHQFIAGFGMLPKETRQFFCQKT